jgi:Myc proto-oncogene protein
MWFLFFSLVLIAEEEIDVVSIGDKNLPTNPSARDRRALQTTVAHKISSATRMMKQHSRNGGIKTIPPRRRISNDSGLMISPASTPKKSANISSLNSPMSGACTPLSGVPSNRKRPPTHKDHHDRMTSSHKRHRGKKQRPMPSKQRIIAEIEDMSLIDTLEKRNLHNDMERQRRIGLKNLFEELKRQIPTIRDKDRAPKVNILREAAVLCTKLNREQEQYNALKKQQTRLLARVKQLRAQVATQRRYVDVE